MGMDTIFRDAVVAVHSAFEPLAEEVTHEAWIGNDGYGAPLYAAGQALKAVVTRRPEARRNKDGQEVVSRAKVDFVEAVPANGAADRVEPLDPRDRITLSDGTGPILGIEGTTDPTTGLPFSLSLWLGWGGGKSR